ncbi:MAG: redoxin domain-containing protein [Desulfuromonadales bacterium]
MQAFQSDIENFEKLNAQVLGVSFDTLETHQEFADQLALSFPLLTDEGPIRKLYGSGRITYLIDQSGVIRYIHKGMPDNAILVQELDKLSED